MGGGSGVVDAAAAQEMREWLGVTTHLQVRLAQRWAERNGRGFTDEVLGEWIGIFAKYFRDIAERDRALCVRVASTDEGFEMLEARLEEAMNSQNPLAA